MTRYLDAVLSKETGTGILVNFHAQEIVKIIFLERGSGVPRVSAASGMVSTAAKESSCKRRRISIVSRTVSNIS